MKIMVLGGGNCQLNFIKRAKHNRHTVIVVDYLPHCPGGKVADEHILVSTFDTPAVLHAAQQKNINAIATLGTDQPVLTAATVAEELGLHWYVDSKVGLAVTNKRVMKRLFTQHDIPTVDYRLIGNGFSDSEISGLKFPAVLKPVDSQGQRGIFLVNDIESVRRHVGETLSFSREHKAMLESFYKSDEITVNGWVTDGKLTLISVVDRVTIKNTMHIGVCLCHNFPSVHLKTYYDEIESLTNRIVTDFGIQNGPVYFQYLIGEDGIKVNEVALRIGGAYEDLTIPLISGIDISAMLLDYITAGTCDTRTLQNYSLKDNRKFVSTQLFFCRHGHVKSITPREEILSLPGVKEVYYAVQEGSIIRHIENATARAGYIIIEGNSFEDMINNINRVFDTLQVLDISGENLTIKYEDYEDKYLFK